MFERVRRWGTGAITAITLALGVASGCSPAVSLTYEPEEVDPYSDLPEGTFLLAPEYQTQVREARDRWETLKIPTKIILANSDLLFDVYGEPIEDNSVVYETLESVISDFDDYYLPNDRLLGHKKEELVYEEEYYWSLDYSVLFFDRGTPNDLSDNYISWDKDTFSPKLRHIPHEGSHDKQDGHPEEVYDALENLRFLVQSGQVTCDDYIEAALVAIEHGDFATTMDFLIDQQDMFLEYIEEDTQDCDDNSLVNYFEEDWIEFAREYTYFRVYTEAFQTSEQGMTEVLEYFYDTGLELYEQNCEQE